MKTRTILFLTIATMVALALLYVRWNTCIDSIGIGGFCYMHALGW